MTKTSKARPARPASRKRRLDAEAREEIKALVKIVGADESCVHGRQLVFHRAKRLPKLEGYASCDGRAVDLVLRGLTLTVAGALLVDLAELRRCMRKHGGKW